MSDLNGERKKEYMNNYYRKRNSFLNYLINRVDELKNDYINK